MIEKLTDNNFMLYAAKHYDNPQCMDIDEFHDDLKRINYIKKLLNKYRTTGDLKERLILNHIIILHNVFGIDAAKVMLLHKIDRRHWYIIKPFLVYLNYIKDTELTDIAMDPTVVERLRDL